MQLSAVGKKPQKLLSWNMRKIMELYSGTDKPLVIYVVCLKSWNTHKWPKGRFS